MNKEVYMKKVLIIEDDKNIAKAMGIRLQAHGYTTATAFDAVVATSTARNFNPDLILLDVSLPGGDGFTLAERFKKIDKIADVPIIFVTASKQNGMREKAIALGAAQYFEKPFESAELLFSVSQLI
jgi:DNA-binding response OmpR family regulator